MDNAGRMDRIRTLISDIGAYQLDALSHQENFKNQSEAAYGALQDYLKSKNMTTTDDLVKDLIKELSPAEQEQILEQLKELTPPTGLAFFLQPSEIAKFFLYGYLISGGVKVSTPYFFHAKAWYISARSNAILQVTRSGQALTEEGRALARLSSAERADLLENLSLERTALADRLEKIYSVRMPIYSGIWEQAEQAEQGLKDIDNAVASVQNIEAQEAKALAAAAKVTVWTKVVIFLSIVAIIGLAIYDKVKEGQIADELRETISKVCTARLYVRMTERMELTHTDQMSTIDLLAQAFKENDDDAQKFLQKNFATTIQNALKNITEDDTYQQLADFDKQRNSNTSEDPSLDDMKKRRAAEENNPLPDRTINSN